MNNLLSIYTKQVSFVSQILSTESILGKHPWAFIPKSPEIKTLTFLNKGELLVQNSTGYSLGKWTLYGKFRLILEYEGNQTFNRIEFINEDIIVLKFVNKGEDSELNPDDNIYLLNEATVDNSNVVGYLENLRNQVLNLTTIELADNRILEIQRENDSLVKPSCPCFIDKIEAPDGIYLARNKHYYYIAYGVLVRETTLVKYYESDGSPIFVEQKPDQRWVSIGDKVFIPDIELGGNRPAKDLLYSEGKETFFVARDGRVIMCSEEPFYCYDI